MTFTSEAFTKISICSYSVTSILYFFLKKNIYLVCSNPVTPLNYPFSLFSPVLFPFLPLTLYPWTFSSLFNNIFKNRCPIGHISSNPFHNPFAPILWAVHCLAVKGHQISRTKNNHKCAARGRKGE